MSQGITIKGKTDADKNVPVRVDDLGQVYILVGNPEDVITPTSPTLGYGIMNIEETATYKYFGFENKDGGWYIMRKTLATNEFLYIAGSSNYGTAWTDRDTHTYIAFSGAF